MSQLIDDILKEYAPQVNKTPALLSILYDVDLLPEQIISERAAINMAAICEAYNSSQYMFEPKELRILETALRNYAGAAQYFTPEHAAEARAVWDKIKNA